MNRRDDPLSSKGQTGKHLIMNDTKGFVKAYHDFRETVDLTRSGFLPSRDDLVWYMLMGVPSVPADEDPSDDSAIVAIEQRVNILKAVFVESNKDQPDDFLNQGLTIYDQAGERAKTLLSEEG